MPGRSTTSNPTDARTSRASPHSAPAITPRQHRAASFPVGFSRPAHAPGFSRTSQPLQHFPTQNPTRADSRITAVTPPARPLPGRRSPRSPIDAPKTRSSPHAPSSTNPPTAAPPSRSPRSPQTDNRADAERPRRRVRWPPPRSSDRLHRNVTRSSTSSGVASRSCPGRISSPPPLTSARHPQYKLFPDNNLASNSSEFGRPWARVRARSQISPHPQIHQTPTNPTTVSPSYQKIAKRGSLNLARLATLVCIPIFTRTTTAHSQQSANPPPAHPTAPPRPYKKRASSGEVPIQHSNRPKLLIQNHQTAARRSDTPPAGPPSPSHPSDGSTPSPYGYNASARSA